MFVCVWCGGRGMGREGFILLDVLWASQISGFLSSVLDNSQPPFLQIFLLPIPSSLLLILQLY